MIYRSTRSNEFQADSLHAVLEGIAPDGGLYIADSFAGAAFDWKACLQQDSVGMETMILSTLLPEFEHMEELTALAYRGRFQTEDLTPLVPVGEDYVLELFRGPTSAFKDVALSMLPRLITAARKQTGMQEEVLILTATSGDTGKAALEGFHDVPGTRIIVFYPDGGVSPVQKAQMATQEGCNVKVCAVRGNFDDCQRGVKETFAAIAAGNLNAGKNTVLSSANSINIGRLAPQVGYYFTAYAKLLESGRIHLGDEVDYVVPTGNFSDILAGYYAKLLGLPVGRLVCASNANNVLTDFINTGVYDSRRPFMRTGSPSMDILVSSNLERFLFLMNGQDGAEVARCMKELKQNGVYTVSPAVQASIKSVMSAYCCDEARTAETIAAVYGRDGYLADPHTAVALAAATDYKQESGTKNPVVVLSTASPYKFPQVVANAIGLDGSADEYACMEALQEKTGVPVPPNLACLREKPVLHTDCIGRDAILDYVLQAL